MTAKGDDALNKSRIEKARKLLVVRRTLVEQLAALDDELEAVIGGGLTMADKVRRLQDDFNTAWGARYAGTYLYQFVKDVPLMKRLVKTFSNEELAARAVSYVRDTDDFLTRAKHPFGIFVSKVNNYAGAKAVSDFELDSDAGPDDCKHLPKCLTDREHTAKRTAERKAVE